MTEFGDYTATLYTIARIADIGNQLMLDSQLHTDAWSESIQMVVLLTSTAVVVTGRHVLVVVLS